ncbi:MAG TPA: thiamine-phosphate synthase family protein [Candidatus Thermoplasmatota archaeon]|nr:thiamine-phosphate synthase family protein [Candidatus Thermoplasmatota archaeon]
MRFAEEVVAERFVPTWRSLLCRRLTERGMSQVEVALALGISQSAVSKHLQGKLGGDAELAREPRLVATVERVAEGLVAKTMSPFQALLEATALVRAFEDRGPICRLHEREMPELAGLGCDICVRVTETTLGAEQAALQDLKGALRILEGVAGIAPLVPHVGTNVARALPGVKDASEVAAVPGRLFVMRGALKVPAAPEFGVSRHMAEVLVAVARADPARLACLNLAPDAALLAAARAAELRVEKVAPEFERAPHTLAFARGVPDVFHHDGAFGIEPQAYFVAGDATTLALRVRELVASRR